MPRSPYPYRGDSPSKKFVRVIYWMQVVALTGGLSRFKQHRHLVLASEEAGDIATLLALGVPSENIVAADLRIKAVRLAQKKFPEVMIHHGDALKIVREYGRTFGSVFLDYCSPITPISRRHTIEVAEAALLDRGVLGCTYIASREKVKGGKNGLPISKLRQVRRAFDTIISRCRKEKRNVTCPEIMHAVHVAENLVPYKQLRPSDPNHSLEEAWDFRSTLARLVYLDHQLRADWKQAVPTGGLETVMEVAYTSVYGAEQSTPMAVLVARAHRARPTLCTKTMPEVHLIDATPASVREFAKLLQKKLPGIAVRGLLNQ
jgi:hypothetical protein